MGICYNPDSEVFRNERSYITIHLKVDTLERVRLCGTTIGVEVVAVLANMATAVLAGGTDIIVQLREGLREADMVVDIKKIDAVTSFKYCDENGLSLGAAVACYNLYEHPQLSKLYGALADSTHIIGGWQIQSRATSVEISLMPLQRQIPYLLHCTNATAVIAGPSGERSVAVEDFCMGPGRNVLENGEFLVSLQIQLKVATVAQLTNALSHVMKWILPS